MLRVFFETNLELCPKHRVPPLSGVWPFEAAIRRNLIHYGNFAGTGSLTDTVATQEGLGTL
ncbi:hypothetical protein AOG2_10460 [Geobacter sp. AOG2]|nr:hypothetical protein AOG2_10460 [Geobacter sp. AOG2]